MANQERKLGEGAAEAIRNAGIIGALIGLIGIWAGFQFGETLFVYGGATGVAGEGAKIMVGGGNNK